MTGNYEFYYASGLLCRLMNRAVTADIRPEALHTLVQELLAEFSPADGHEKHLAHMLRYYHPDQDRYDGQMAQLLQMGLQEAHMWERIVQQGNPQPVTLCAK